MDDRSERGGARLPGPRQVRRAAATVAMVGLGIHLVLPQLAGLRATARAISDAPPWLPLLLVALEAASLLAYGRLLLLLLRAGGQQVTEHVVQRTVLVGLTFGRTLPGGAAAAFAVELAALRARGLDPVRSAAAMWGSGLLSSAVLALLLPIGAAIGVLGGHLGAVGLPVGLAALVLLSLTALVPLALRDPPAFGARVGRLVRPLARGPLRTRLRPPDVAARATGAATDLRGVTRDPGTLGRAVAWASANWLLDLAVVVLLAMTVGEGTALSDVLLAYVVAQLAAAVPLTPGGVGVVETAMIGALVAAGSPSAAATATVLGWRLVSHWLPIGIGLLLLPGLRGRGTPDDGGPPPTSGDDQPAGAV